MKVSGRPFWQINEGSAQVASLPSRYGVRRQNEVATALWPWRWAWVNAERLEQAKAVSR
jgi:hypothetical protein